MAYGFPVKAAELEDEAPATVTADIFLALPHTISSDEWANTVYECVSSVLDNSEWNYVVESTILKG